MKFPGKPNGKRTKYSEIFAHRKRVVAKIRTNINIPYVHCTSQASIYKLWWRITEQFFFSLTVFSWGEMIFFAFTAFELSMHRIFLEKNPSWMCHLSTQKISMNLIYDFFNGSTFQRNQYGCFCCVRSSNNHKDGPKSKNIKSTVWTIDRHVKSTKTEKK